MFFRLMCIFGVIATPVLARSEAVQSYSMTEDQSGYPCFLKLETAEETDVTIQLSDYKDIWSINVWVNNRPSIYRTLFTSRSSIPDSDALLERYSQIEFGGSSFDLVKAVLYEIGKQDVDRDTAAAFELAERHNVARALKGMREDGIVINGLIRLTNTTSPAQEFRTCAYEAMGLEVDEHVSTDFRAEYRRIFERSFEKWASSMSQAEHCLRGRFDDDLLAETIDLAADAFYPGLLNVVKRSEYRKDLERKIPLAKLRGMADAVGNGCLLANQLAKASRIPVEHAINAASKLD